MTGQRSEFTDFFRVAEPKLKVSLCAGFGTEVGLEATSQALAYGWEHWTRVQEMQNPVGYLWKVGRDRARRIKARDARHRSMMFASVPTAELHWFEPGLPLALARLSERQRTEILLVPNGPTGDIARAFPMPNTPPSWIEVTEDFVYVGRIGDGALSHAALVRIDRNTLEAVFVVIGADGAAIPSWMWGSEWLAAEESYSDRLAAVVGIGSEAPGKPVTSWIGDVRVDIEGVDRIIRELIASGGVNAG